MVSSPRTNAQGRLKTVLGFLTLAACGAVLEGGIRLDDWRRQSAPSGGPPELSLLDPNPAGTGSYRMRPNLDLTTRIGREEIRIKTNSYGMHWREVPIDVPKGVQRVAFLGDSFTFGSWAADASKSFVGIFDARLQGRGIEALNFGVGGYGYLDEELMLKELALRFSPKYVVLATFMGNDFRDTWLGLDRETLVNGTARLNEATLKERVPPEDLVDDAKTATDCPEPLWRRAANHSALFRRVAPILDLEDLCVHFRPNRNFFMPGFWSRTPPPEIAIRARDASFAVLERIKDLSEARGARFAIVAIPTSDQVYALQNAGRGFDTAFPQSYLQEFCRDRRIPYLDLLPPLRDFTRTSNRRLYWKNDIHFNDFGHERVGELIAQWFEASVIK